jgi:hypothetical protein
MGRKSFKQSLVRKGGLEPPRFYPPDPKSGASANSATFALIKSNRPPTPKRRTFNRAPRHSKLDAHRPGKDLNRLQRGTLESSTMIPRASSPFVVGHSTQEPFTRVKTCSNLSLSSTWGRADQQKSRDS